MQNRNTITMDEHESIIAKLTENHRKELDEQRRLLTKEIDDLIYKLVRANDGMDLQRLTLAKLSELLLEIFKDAQATRQEAEKALESEGE